MKKTIQIVILIIFIILGLVLFSTWWLNKYFFRVDDSYPSELFGFKPEKLNYHANKPIYYYSNDSLYFDSSGVINFSNNPIWTKPINKKGYVESGVFVSPNSQYIAFIENNRIIILDKNGNVIHSIETFDKTISDDATFWGKEVQWSENSTKLYFMQYKKWDSFLSEKNRSTLYVYSITDDKIRRIIDLPEEICEDFFISRDEKTLIYRFVASDGNMPFKKVDMLNGKYKGQFEWDRWHKLKESRDSIFINYSVNHFGNFSQDYNHLITTLVKTDSIEGGLYYYSDTLTKLIIKGKRGYGAFKGNSYSYRMGGEFLPWNKYYVCRINSKKIKGTVIIDVETCKYDFINKTIYCFYSMTNNDPFDFEKMNNMFETSIDNRIN